MEEGHHCALLLQWEPPVPVVPHCAEYVGQLRVWHNGALSQRHRQPNCVLQSLRQEGLALTEHGCKDHGLALPRYRIHQSGNDELLTQRIKLGLAQVLQNQLDLV